MHFDLVRLSWFANSAKVYMEVLRHGEVNISHENTTMVRVVWIYDGI